MAAGRKQTGGRGGLDESWPERARERDFVSSQSAANFALVSSTVCRQCLQVGLKEFVDYLLNNDQRKFISGLEEYPEYP